MKVEYFATLEAIPDDEISDPDEDTLQGQMAKMRGENVKSVTSTEDDDDDDDDDSEAGMRMIAALVPAISCCNVPMTRCLQLALVCGATFQGCNPGALFTIGYFNMN